MTSRQIFSNACSGQNSDRPPFWIMRQAGRYLPEYRKLKSKYGFLEIVKNPDLSAEATLQPMRRFGFDCAIIFSDILVVAEALGFPYEFKDGGGIIMRRKIGGMRDIEAIDTDCNIVREKLAYVVKSLSILRRELPDKALLGFCASAFTLAAYMVEGCSSTNFPSYSKFINEYPAEFRLLTQKLSKVLGEYAKMQAECGIDGFQIFDSHATLASLGRYEELSAVHISEIVSQIPSDIPSILFAKGMSARFGELLKSNAKVYSLDSESKLSEIFNKFRGKFALQGNLDQNMLATGNPASVRQKTLDVIADMNGTRSHILNLGHGITPDAKLENVEAFCQTAREFQP